MKKLILLVSMIMTLAFSMVAFAAGDGSALNAEQKNAEKLLSEQLKEPVSTCLRASVRMCCAIHSPVTL